jgi:hypothetical protein
MLTTGAAGAGGGGGGAATAPPPPPPPPIIIIIIIIIDGSVWFLLFDRFWMELVICVIIVVSWSVELLDRDVTRDAPPETRVRSFEAIELNRFFMEGMVDSFVVTEGYRALGVPASARHQIDQASRPCSGSAF